MNKLLAQFWTTRRFVIANVAIAVALWVGLGIVGTTKISGEILGIVISGPAIWFFAIAIVWVLVAATFAQVQSGKHDRLSQFPIVSGAGSWLLSATLGWLIFVGMLNLYVFINIIQQ